jgi:hypothetical protein
MASPIHFLGAILDLEPQAAKLKYSRVVLRGAGRNLWQGHPRSTRGAQQFEDSAALG